MEWARSLIKKVEDTRQARLTTPAPELSADESQALLEKYHPDYSGQTRALCVGPNASDDELFPQELADMLESASILPADFQPTPDIETDVLILGGGGSAASAALALEGSGFTVHLATKLRLGDSNTVMAEGGIQSALGNGDSPRRHFADSFVGGHGANDSGLLKILCESGPNEIRRLSELGCLFDRTEDGRFRLRLGGGASLPRVLACRDYTGLEIMRVLRDAVRLTSVTLLEESPVVELLDDGEGNVTGAVLWDRKNNKTVCVSARAVLLATGGAGQLRLQGFGTSNHIGATADGLTLAYRQNCRLVHANSFQYHPSGACYPPALAGRLVTEAIRSLGAQVVNCEGRHFVSEMTFRDILSSAIIREVKEGRGVETPTGSSGVWLDTPLIDIKHGEGALRQQFPGLFHRWEPFGIDPSKLPILIFPTLHYQNGGIRINEFCQTDAPGLWASGEATGGVHGTNRLMGNSLLDVVAFGRRAGEHIRDHLPSRKPITTNNAERFRSELNIKRPNAVKGPLLFPKAMNVKIKIGD